MAVGPEPSPGLSEIVEKPHRLDGNHNGVARRIELKQMVPKLAGRSERKIQANPRHPAPLRRGEFAQNEMIEVPADVVDIPVSPVLQVRIGIQIPQPPGRSGMGQHQGDHDQYQKAFFHHGDPSFGGARNRSAAG